MSYAQGHDSMMDTGSGSDEEDEGAEDLDDLLLAERDSDSQVSHLPVNEPSFSAMLLLLNLVPYRIVHSLPT